MGGRDAEMVPDWSDTRRWPAGQASPTRLRDCTSEYVSELHMVYAGQRSQEDGPIVAVPRRLKGGDGLM